ncbi:MAG: S8 family serine peptidase [Candidatus Thorarchaeota archaeon]
MDEIIDENGPNRGKALLVISMVIVATTFAFLILPRAFGPPELTVRVAVIDSGMDKDSFLVGHIVAEASFINSTYGYRNIDSSTEDSKPHGTSHGNYVARIIVEEAPHAAIINAKVVNSANKATAAAIIAAIEWAVIEQECDVINLSLGGTPSNLDGIHQIVKWAFSRGVVIVAAAGNNAQGGITGSSIESPAVYSEVISVGAVDESEKPYPFSGIGPLVNRTLKPDISAPGYFHDTSVSLYGTSFATPYVTAGAAELINYCKENGWKWTPGMIKATILESSKYLGYEHWQVGAGLLDIDSAIKLINSAEKIDNLPIVVYMTSDLGEYEFERWFANTTVRIRASVFSSNNATFIVRISGTARPWISAPDRITMNQTYEIPISIRLESLITWTSLQAQISLESNVYRSVSSKLTFGMTIPLRKVAFDLSHTPWWMDSIYGQFREFYSRATSLGISVEEIRDRSDVTFENLRSFDAIIILDPCAWEFIEIEERAVPYQSIRYSVEELAAYSTYWNKGGNIMIAGGSNFTIDVEGANQLLSIFNITLNFDSVPMSTFLVNGVANSIKVIDIIEHPITELVSSFDYNGATLSVTKNQTIVAQALTEWIDTGGVRHSALKPVLVAAEGRAAARLVVTGSNFFIDNWGLNGIYGSHDNSLMMIGCLYWLTHVPGF